jgi:CheY-like chemotaxis protein
MDVAHRLQREPGPKPILIAVTAHAFPEQRQTIIDAGFSDLLTKPVSVELLEMTLMQAYRGDYNICEVSKKRRASGDSDSS